MKWKVSRACVELLEAVASGPLSKSEEFQLHGEKWGPISYPGYKESSSDPCAYRFVSSKGRVFRNDGSVREAIREAWTNSYPTVWVNNRLGTVSLHKLTLFSLLGWGKPKVSSVDHKSREKGDACLENLRLASPTLQSTNRQFFFYDFYIPVTFSTGVVVVHYKRKTDAAKRLGVSTKTLTSIIDQGDFEKAFPGATCHKRVSSKVNEVAVDEALLSQGDLLASPEERTLMEIKEEKKLELSTKVVEELFSHSELSSEALSKVTSSLNGSTSALANHFRKWYCLEKKPEVVKLLETRYGDVDTLMKSINRARLKYRLAESKSTDLFHQLLCEESGFQVDACLLFAKDLSFLEGFNTLPPKDQPVSTD